MNCLWVACVVLGVVAVYASEDRERRYYKHKKQINRCYQCAYSPPRIFYQEKKVPLFRKYGDGRVRKLYKLIKTSKQGSGGWDKCEGPFNEYDAQTNGIDVWECESNCYTRVDSNGNIFRGCYNGEFGVDPKRTGCHKQAGSLYCICEGDKCNNAAAPRTS